jgi:hypothetical protein
LGNGFIKRNAVRPGDSNLTGEQTGGTAAGQRTASAGSWLGGAVNAFSSFLQGLDVYMGLTVYDFITNYGFLTAAGGSDLSGGVQADNLNVTGYFYIGTPTVAGCFRMYLDATTPLPKLQIEQLTTLPDTWTWRGEFSA